MYQGTQSKDWRVMQKFQLFCPGVSNHREALPLYGHPLLKKEWFPSFPGVSEFCEKHFAYNLDTDSVMIFPGPLGHEKYDMERTYEYYEKNRGKRTIYAFTYNTIDRNFPDPDIGENDFYFEDIISYQTSMYKSERKKNQFPFPPLIDDYFENQYYRGPISIFWRGNHKFNRILPLSVIESTKYKKDFAITPIGSEFIESSKKLFLNKMTDNLFSFCIRGGANFCRRFYETLMMGRIPILFQSDRCFIFEDYGIDLNDICIVLEFDVDIFNKESLVKKFEEKIDSWISTHDVDLIQRQNREIWEKYCSPLGFLKNFYSTLKA